MYSGFQHFEQLFMVTQTLQLQTNKQKQTKHVIIYHEQRNIFSVGGGVCLIVYILRKYTTNVYYFQFYLFAPVPFKS